MTPLDQAHYIAAGFDPDEEAERDRDRAVGCWCGQSTWNQAGCCDTHYEPPVLVRMSTATSAQIRAMKHSGRVLDDLFDSVPEDPTGPF